VVSTAFLGTSLLASTGDIDLFGNESCRTPSDIDDDGVGAE
jgi:hypothetical protein